MPDVFGFAEMNARILNLIRALPEEIENALLEEAKKILEVAKSRTPVKTGALRDSGRIQEFERDGFNTSIKLSFGDPEPYYAIYVHEDLDARHEPPFGTGGQAKFLESAIQEATPGMSSRIGQRIKIERLVT